MKASIIGTGRMGQGLAKVLSPVIPDLLWASRSKEKVSRLMEEGGYEALGVKAASYEEALQSDIIFHSLWFRDVIPWAVKHRDCLSGKILVDLCNPFTDDFSDFTTDWGTSAAEELQRVIPQCYVVGAFKNTFFKVLEQPIHHNERSDVYVTGDDQQAKETIMRLLHGIPFRILDGGKLSNNRTIERMTLFERELAIRYGHYPYVSFKLFGMEEQVDSI
ncbi:hypothetical protein GCM10023310_43330 [Paenibacillus vulneris]|uniref:NADPH-dependent F420 reductase n=1 Tax=Paenibacillus vulneris TaxID=1133364 RepID=A0ABW3UV77_9BACL|nr:NAD(P)-binding domain-containing protein [Paenibacillus sp. 32352]